MFIRLRLAMSKMRTRQLLDNMRRVAAGAGLTDYRSTKFWSLPDGQVEKLDRMHYLWILAHLPRHLILR
jgi:hypothetical protein